MKTRTESTTRSALRSLLRRSSCATACAALFAASAHSKEEPLHVEAQATLRSETTFRDSPFDEKEVTGFFDQYQYTRDKDGDATNFTDLAFAEVKWLRPDDTALFSLNRRSDNSLNESGQLRLDIPSVDFRLGYLRYRSETLRFFPTGTGDNGFFPAFASAHTPDTEAGEIFDHDRRLYSRRQGLATKLRFLPEELDLEAGPVRETWANFHYQTRKGYDQDSFLLDSSSEPVTSADLRFRANRREFDQEVTGGGGGFVLSPFGLFEASLSANAERFRENASPVTLDTLASQPNGQGDFPALDTDEARREFRFVPDSERIGAKLRLARKLEAVSIRGGAHFTRLRQAGDRSPLQDLYDISRPEVSLYGAHAAADWDITRDFSANAFIKYRERHNHLDRSETYAAGEISGLGQESPLLREQRRLDTELAFATDYWRGSKLALGYRGSWTDRSLRYPESDTQGIQPRVSLVDNESLRHTAFVRGRTRLFRIVQVSGEVGYEVAPKTAYGRELEEAFYIEARSSTGWIRPCPIQLSLAGRVKSGKNDDIELREIDSRASRHKEYERTDWRYHLSLTAVPHAKLSLYSVFAHEGNHQDFDHVRSTEARNSVPSSIEFFEDSSPDFDVRSESLVIGGRYQVTDALTLSATSQISWHHLDFDHDSIAARELDKQNEITRRVASVETEVAYDLTTSLRISAGYRFDDFHDGHDRIALDYDDTRHAVSASMTYHFDSREPARGLPWIGSGMDGKSR